MSTVSVNTTATSTSTQLGGNFNTHATRFTVNKDMYVTAVMVKVTNSGGTGSGYIYDGTSQNLLGETAYNANMSLGWNQLAFSTPIKLLAGNYYHIAFYNSGGPAAMLTFYNNCTNAPSDSGDGVTYSASGFYTGASQGEMFPSRLNSSSYCIPTGLVYTLNTAPNAPTHANISSSGASYNTLPRLYFDVTDKDGDQLIDMRVQIGTDVNFTSGSSLLRDDVYSTYTNQRFVTSFPVNSGSRVCYSGAGTYPFGTIYVRACVQDSKGAWSEWATIQSFTIKSVPWTDTIPAGLYGFKAQWLNDIYTCIKDIRAFRHWGTVSPQDGTLSKTNDIKAVHIMERRKYLSDVMKAFSSSTPAWTNSELTNLLTTNQANGGNETGTTNTFFAYTDFPNSSGFGIETGDSPYASGWGCVKLTSNYTQATQYICIHTGGSPTPALPNKTYTAGVWAKGPSGKTGLFLGYYQDSNQNRIGQLPMISFTFTGDWQFVTNKFQTPANTSALQFELGMGAANNDFVKWGGGFLVEGDPYALDRNTQHILELRNYILQA